MVQVTMACYTHGSNSILVGYCDADWASSADDRKITSEGFFFLGNNLLYWFSKKQNCLSLSIVEAEYIAAGSSCSQLIWMKQMLKEYNVKHDVMTLYCDNMGAINISKNPIQHSRISILTSVITLSRILLKTRLLPLSMWPLRSN